MKTFYTNAKIFRNGRFEPGLIAVEGGRIAAAGEPRPGDRVVDLGGRHLVPGLVDVPFRQGGILRQRNNPPSYRPAK